ncbi:hypothetical protein ACPV4H_19545 [Vibrio rotiferianus]|uniref:hypothetical protein n=1 Tax=Vibrio rotiferianus TaxID=190895 RepID=UPI00406A5E7C
MSSQTNGSVVPQPQHALQLSLPSINGYTEKFLTPQEYQNALTRVSSNAHQVMINTIHNNSGVQSDTLTNLSGVTNLSQYRHTLNQKLQPLGFEARCFKVPGQSRNADFFHWHFVEYNLTARNVPPIQTMNVGVGGANEDTLQ